MQHVARSDSAGTQISGLTYAEIYGQTPNMYTTKRLEKYSDSLRGTKVLWTGKVIETETDGTVHVAMDNHRTPNVDFNLKPGEADILRSGLNITFTGTISSITSIQTFPPMPNMHVFLVDMESVAQH